MDGAWFIKKFYCVVLKFQQGNCCESEVNAESIS